MIIFTAQEYFFCLVLDFFEKYGYTTLKWDTTGKKAKLTSTTGSNAKSAISFIVYWLLDSTVMSYIYSFARSLQNVEKINQYSTLFHDVNLVWQLRFATIQVIACSPERFE